jgi:hypothetical protein
MGAYEAMEELDNHGAKPQGIDLVMAFFTIFVVRLPSLQAATLAAAFGIRISSVSLRRQMLSPIPCGRKIVRRRSLPSRTSMNASQRGLDPYCGKTCSPIHAFRQATCCLACDAASSG